MHPTRDDRPPIDTEPSEERLADEAGGLIWVVVAVAAALYLSLTLFT